MSLECGDVFAKLSEYLDGELPEDICAKMRTHIGDCAPCVEFVESLRKSIELCKNGSPVDGPGALSVECRDALWKAYSER
jgi:anti-sigma factor RsiW